MNLRTFADSLTPTEINELSSILYEKKKEFAKQNLKPLNHEMVNLVRQGRWINAIKEYRSFYNASLFEAKLAVDSFRGL